MSLKNYIEEAKNIIIVGHFTPDGDAVGSTMALKYFLENMSKNATVLLPNAFSENLQWMDPNSSILFFDRDNELAKKKIEETDLIFCMDCNSFGRTEKMGELLKASSAQKVLIDHHISPCTEEFNLVFSQETVSSTCEKLYYVLHEELDWAFADKRVCSCLYAGVSTDTGSFAYSCSRRQTFDMVSGLIEKGADIIRIHRAIFDTFSASRMRLLGYCINNKLIVRPEYATAYMSLSLKELNDFGYKEGDLEGVVNYALGIKGIMFAAFFTERPTEKEHRIRISLRSKEDVDVNVLARAHFNGGGHKNAAGGTLYTSLDEALEKLEKILPDFYKNEIEKNIHKTNLSLI